MISCLSISLATCFTETLRFERDDSDGDADDGHCLSCGGTDTHSRQVSRIASARNLDSRSRKAFS